MKQTVLRPSCFRFRRWSRKAYAAFASIGRHVTIGCVNKRIADKSLSKQESAGTAGKCWEGRLYPIDTEELRADKETPPDLCHLPTTMGDGRDAFIEPSRSCIPDNQRPGQGMQIRPYPAGTSRKHFFSERPALFISRP